MRDTAAPSPVNRNRCLSCGHLIYSHLRETFGATGSMRSWLVYRHWHNESTLCDRSGRLAIR